jgi:DNA-binding Xre family transcriptional regulator
MSTKKNPHRGSSFDSFLEEEGLFEEVQAAALKKVIAARLRQQMERRSVSVSELASTMKTSRAAVNRILDERNTSITLNTLSKAASVLGCRLKVELKSA